MLLRKTLALTNAAKIGANHIGSHKHHLSSVFCSFILIKKSVFVTMIDALHKIFLASYNVTQMGSTKNGDQCHFNRVMHQFNYRALLTAVERQAVREGVTLRKVKPAYTSMIGRFKYHPQYGISVHHAAALVIGRRGGLKVRRENVPKALRRWMQDRDQWNDPAYRKNDWSTWARIQRVMTKTWALHHQYVSGWSGYRKTILSEIP